jgi:hypothetical protein
VRPATFDQPLFHSSQAAEASPSLGYPAAVKAEGAGDTCHRLGRVAGKAVVFSALIMYPLYLRPHLIEPVLDALPAKADHVRDGLCFPSAITASTHMKPTEIRLMIAFCSSLSCTLTRKGRVHREGREIPDRPWSYCTPFQGAVETLLSKNGLKLDLQGRGVSFKMRKRRVTGNDSVSSGRRILLQAPPPWEGGLPGRNQFAPELLERHHSPYSLPG